MLKRGRILISLIGFQKFFRSLSCQFFEDAVKASHTSKSALCGKCLQRHITDKKQTASFVDTHRIYVDDPFPDTYCPSNPKTYEIVFDILDEVIQVFKPKHIHIGHDELYTACVCERCKDKKPADIYAEDVRKISNYLAGKGVGTMMWGEKLLRARWDERDGAKVGGWFDEKDQQRCSGRVCFQLGYQCV